MVPGLQVQDEDEALTSAALLCEGKLVEVAIRGRELEEGELRRAEVLKAYGAYNGQKKEGKRNENICWHLKL